MCSRDTMQTVQQIKIQKQMDYHHRQYMKACTTKPKQGTNFKWRVDAQYHLRKRMALSQQYFSLTEVQN